VRIDDFGDGVAEAVVIKQREPLPRKRRAGEKVSRSRADMSHDDLRRSIIRARKQMRHKLLMMRADRMLTLTYRENITDVEMAYKHLAKFEKSCRRYWKGFTFVAVLEYQKRGAIHFHLALNTFYHVAILRKFWHRAIGSTDGNVDMTSPRKGGKWNRVKIARYMAKYMGKSVDLQEVGRKRYTSSRGIPAPDTSRYYIALGPDTFRQIFRLIQEKTGRPVKAWGQVEDAIYPTWFISTY
jgi:hypothetical protein